MSVGGGTVVWCELLRDWAGELGRVWGGGCAESMPSCKEADAGVTRLQHVVPSEFGRKLYTFVEKSSQFLKLAKNAKHLFRMCRAMKLYEQASGGMPRTSGGTCWHSEIQCDWPEVGSSCRCPLRTAQLELTIHAMGGCSRDWLCGFIRSAGISTPLRREW